MVQGILGKKLGMTRVYRGDGEAVPVTVLQAGPCVVVQRKTGAADGYEAAQLGLVETRPLRRAPKAVQKHFAKAGLAPMRFVREVRLQQGAEDTKAGDAVKVDLFQPKDRVNVIGVSKGRGFAGVVKRHGFAGGPKTHGQSDRLRHPGAIGSTTYPGRVWKGLRMAGRMGADQVTVRGLEVRGADTERNLLLVKGAVPGSKNGLLLIRKSGE